MKFGFQTTLRDRVEICGFGVHSAAPARVVLHPADVNSGIVILRTGLAWRARAPDRGEMVERHADRAVHRARRLDRRGGGDRRASDGRARRPSGRQRAGRDRRPGNADHGRLGGPIRRGDRFGRPRPPGAPAPLHPHVAARCGSRAGRAYAEFRPARTRLPARRRDRFRSGGDRPPAARLRPRSVGLPKRDRERPHFRLRQRRQEAVAGGVRLGLVAGEFGRPRRRRHPQSRGPALRRRVRPPQGARRRRRSGAGRRADPRRATVPIARATRSTR